MTTASAVIVVDASVALKWVFDEDGSDWARSFLAMDRPLTAPALLWTECTNAVWRMSRGVAAPPDARAALVRRIVDTGLEMLRGMPVNVVPLDLNLHDVALRLARTLDHPIYDCLYLALAIRENAALATADLSFRRVLRTSAVLATDRLLTPPDA